MAGAFALAGGASASLLEGWSIGVGLVVVGMIVARCAGVAISVDQGTVRVRNRFRSHAIAVDHVVAIENATLDRDPKSPPALRLVVSDGSGTRRTMIDASASPDLGERQELAILLRPLGLGSGTENRYLRW
jgi:hypothetical protein